MFQTRLTRSRSGQPSSAPVNARNTLSVIVVPDGTDDVAEAEKSLPPIAPSDNTFNLDRPDISDTILSLGTMVDVSTSFSSRLLDGRTRFLMCVKDKSRRPRFGQASRMVLTTESLSGAWRSFRERKLGRWKSCFVPKASHNLWQAPSVWGHESRMSRK